ncbi:MAG: PTS sugar transporter subunit IIA [Phycisphaerales bacterium]|nr:PTS sugar transporter subunit IIA [Phycisphaerales bacterium]
MTNPSAAERGMKLSDLVPAGAIVANLRSSDRNGVIRELVAVLAAKGVIAESEVEPVSRSIVTRERTRGTTGFGRGVAAPHTKLDGLKRVAVAVGRSAGGVDFSALDGEPVFGVFLVLSPLEQPEHHLRAMDVIFRVLQQEKFRKFLRQADTDAKIAELLREADEQPARPGPS